jgi:hypothetical protein
MTGIQTKLEYLKELEKLTLKALQAITDVNDLCGFGIDNGFCCGCGGDIDNQDYLTESLENIRKAIKTEEFMQDDDESGFDLIDYIKSIEEAYESAKKGSK